MTRLIEDLLDTAQIRKGGLRLEPAFHRVGEMLADVSDLRPIALQKRIRLDVRPVEEDLVLFCDRARIGQALANLVTNAIKFSFDESTVTIAAERVEGGVQFTVRDEGPGISADKVAHVFERFWQSPATAAGGVGLGLFIAKGIVDAHGGTITVQSAEREGATFAFLVPDEASVRRACEPEERRTVNADDTLPPSSTTVAHS